MQALWEALHGGKIMLVNGPFVRLASGEADPDSRRRNAISINEKE